MDYVNFHLMVFFLGLFLFTLWLGFVVDDIFLGLCASIGFLFLAVLFALPDSDYIRVRCPSCKSKNVEGVIVNVNGKFEYYSLCKVCGNKFEG